MTEPQNIFFSERDIIHTTAVVATLLIIEIRDFETDFTDPIWIGVLTSVFQSSAYFCMLGTVFIDVLFVFLWTNKRSIESKLMQPTLFLLAGLVLYLIQLIFVVIIQFYRLQTSEAGKDHDYKTLSFLAFALPQYAFYTFFAAYSSWLYMQGLNAAPNIPAISTRQSGVSRLQRKSQTHRMPSTRQPA